MKSFTIILLKLPSGKIALQRRTKDAPYAPDKLGLFGGWIEDGETPDECVRREMAEETSLDVGTHRIKLLRDFVIPRSDDFDEDRHFFLFTTNIKDMAFEVYEGQGSEEYTVNELKKRSDLTSSTEFVFSRILN